ncbi:MAG TPA: 2-oxoacid:acceptor oxidoreductase subunit alpha [Sulfurovum sp.]|nr:2-oxoacid:acceptor oxidoreductase subunit alpha [Sulfurovum sp.]
MKNINIPFQASLKDPPVSLPRYKKQTPNSKAQTIDILIGGAAGSGINILENILNKAFMLNGYFVYSTKEFMSRVRGGSNTVLLRISNQPIHAPCWHVDLFVALDKNALPHVQERLTQRSYIIADENDPVMEDKQKNIIPIPMIQTAKDLGDIRYANSYVAGLLFGILKADLTLLLKSVLHAFSGDTQNENETAMKEGYHYSEKLTNISLPKIPQTSLMPKSNFHLLDGSSAVGFGSLLGGCTMITSYPMSPSTGVLNFMASMSKEFTILVEQSEDEIAAFAMVLGGWFGGARAMTSTSGGGFALMSEGISLSGVSETPAVIYLAQRPGPATGMPTRTEQGDLNLAIHSGHGDFGRIILAPGSLEECLNDAYLAFELADRYQVPVILLSDQYLADTINMMDKVDFTAYEQRRYIVKSDIDYKRYTLNEEGISPRGVPGFGQGIVGSSSHEHDERGQSTEDYKVREIMVKKRENKLKRMISEAYRPEIHGKGSIAIIGWGSTKGAIFEALKGVNDPRLFQVHFVWVHPLNLEHLEILKQNKTNIIIENNVSGQFADILKGHGVHIHHRILQSNGFAFFTDLLQNELSDIIKDIQ